MLNIPNSWSEISFSEYLEIINIQQSNLSHFNKNLELIALLNEVSVDDELLDDLDVDEASEYIKQMQWINSAPKSGLVKSVLGYELKDLNNLLLGEYISLDKLISENHLENLPKMCAILYKKVKKDEFGNAQEEPFIYNINTRAKEFEQQSITTIYPILEYFAKYKELFLERYKGCFESLDEDISEELSEEDKKEIEKEIQDEKTKAKFSWHFFIWNLCDGDLTKYESVTNLPLILVFNMMSMKKVFSI